MFLKNKLTGTFLLFLLAGSAIADFTKGELLYYNNFDTVDAFGEKYRQAFRSGKGLAEDGAFEVAGYQGANFIILDLDPVKLKGRILMEAVVKADRISKPEKAHFGAKLMLVIQRKNGKTLWPEPATMPKSGSSDWKTVSLVQVIPDDTVSVKLYFGVQNATGKFLIDSISIYRAEEK